LQIEGTGAKPTNVIFDAQFQRLNALRADRSNGIYIKNFAAERTTFNAFYMMETDGFILDSCLGRWNDEYGFLTFADDHGLYKNCEACGNGDSGIYPGAAHNINANEKFTVSRYAIEIENCYSHDNALGYSGTAGDSVWAHDNVFMRNATGVSTDSLFPEHPGLPQNHAKFERNVIADNNADYYAYVRDGTCNKPQIDRGYENGVVCPCVGIPTGTGVINAGGDWNIWQHNWVYGNHYAGFILTWAPGLVRNAKTWAARYDLVSQTVPCNCQWFGAKGFGRLDVQISTGEGVLTVLLVAVLLWRCLSPPSSLSVVGALVGVAGAVVGVIGAIYEATPWCG